MKILYFLRFFFRVFFKLKTIKKAKKMGLTFIENIHGDGINLLNARSIWKDKFEFQFFCAEYNENA